MRTWPARLFVLFGLLVLLGVGLGAASAAVESSDTEGSDALWSASTAAILCGLAVFPLATLTALATLLQQPGTEAQRRVRLGLACFCALAWLAAIALAWAGRVEGTDADPSAPVTTALAGAALLPFALWPAALWLTAPQRGRRPPLAPLGWLLALTGAALALASLSAG